MQQVLGCNVLVAQRDKRWHYRVFDYDHQLLVDGCVGNADLALLNARQDIVKLIMKRCHSMNMRPRRGWRPPVFATEQQLLQWRDDDEQIERVVIDWEELYKRLLNQTVHKTVTIPLNVFERTKQYGGYFSSVVLQALTYYLDAKDKERNNV